MTTAQTRRPLAFLDQELQTLEAEGRRIKLRILQGAQKPVSVIDGKRVVNLTSNNYLNLTVHPKLKKAARDAVRTHGVGTAAVRTIIGTMDLNMELERRLALFKGTEAAL
ncbi:MAG TPA: 8-amino-7-oxononanoate synthase, partial [Elusimicrobia bacterium]|nr:8-amino-7-oxononanoate synthase [Elusimicrobiota bacterium]